jgi:ribosomal protein S6
MNYYEFNLLITPNFGEEQVKEFNETLSKKIKDIKLISEINTSAKKLSYEIEGEKTAWLTYFNVTLDESKRKEILDEAEKLLKETPEVLRYLILSKKESLPKPERRVKKEKEEKEEPEQINIEKVDEKVEELLKEE